MQPRIFRRTTKRVALIIGVTLAVLAPSCGSGEAATSGASDGPAPDSIAFDGIADSITLYSGRNEELIAPLLEAFTAETGVTVEARYADSAELALLIQTEGDSSPADVFISQSPGALGFLDGAERLVRLDDEILNRVGDGFQAGDGTWVGLTGRVRTLVYNRDLVDEASLPDSVLDLAKPEYAGRVAVAPTNGSFQDFITAMRDELGDDATMAWLQGMAANKSPNYPKNSAIVEAVGRGEVEMGLVNHYYNLRALEADPSAPSVNYFFPADDMGALVIITGAAVLDSSDAPTTAQQLIEFLLSDAAQATFVTETDEYALASGVSPSGPDGAPDLSAFVVDSIDFDLLGEGLAGTQQLIRDSGIEQ